MAFPPRPELPALLASLTRALEARGLPFMLIGVVEGVAVPVATAEDLLLHKLFAGRPRDIEDAESVVRRSGPSMDWVYVERWARTFAEVPGREEMPAAMERLRRCS